MKTTNNKYVAPVAEMIELNAQVAILEGSLGDGNFTAGNQVEERD
jgi:hypothetical protein